MSKRMLCIESATDALSVALLSGAETVIFRAADGTRQHTSVLLPAIDAVLTEAGWPITSLDRLGISLGPGSFTSLRIGLATAKGLAFGRDLEAVGVSTLEAMARAHDGAPGDEVLCLLDARRGEWYAGSWRCEDAAQTSRAWTPALPEGLYDPGSLARDTAGRALSLVGPELDAEAHAFRVAGVGVASVVCGAAAGPRADSVGQLAIEAFERGEGGPAASLQARYLRRAQAEAKRLGQPVEAGEVVRVEESAD